MPEISRDPLRLPPGAGIRLSPHFYNRDDELDLAVAAIREIQVSGAWQDFASATCAVT